MQVSGSCHCGSIHFTADTDPSKVMVCHCTDCQRLTGSAFRVVVPAPMASFKLHGEPKRYVKVGESGARRTQAFCPECGSPLYAVALDKPSHVSLRVGTLDQRAQFLPYLQIWERSALSWAKDLSSVPGCEKQEALDP